MTTASDAGPNAPNETSRLSQSSRQPREISSNPIEAPGNAEAKSEALEDLGNDENVPASAEPSEEQSSDGFESDESSEDGGFPQAPNYANRGKPTGPVRGSSTAGNVGSPKPRPIRPPASDPPKPVKSTK